MPALYRPMDMLGLPKQQTQPRCQLIYHFDRLRRADVLLPGPATRSLYLDDKDLPSSVHQASFGHSAYWFTFSLAKDVTRYSLPVHSPF